MSLALRIQTIVLPGHRIEVAAPELPEGERVEVLVRTTTTAAPKFPSVLEFLKSLPPGPRSSPTWHEFEKQFQEERNSWER